MTVKQAPRHRGNAKPFPSLNSFADTTSLTSAGKKSVAFASVTGIALTAAVTSAASASTATTVLPQVPYDDFVSHLEETDSTTLVSLDVDWESGDEVAVVASAPATQRAVAQPVARVETPILSQDVDQAANLEFSPNSSANGIVETALQYVGYAYSYGGSSPATGFDCSGFTSYIFAQYGIFLPRTAAAQGGAGTQIPASAAQPGDLVVWSDGGHVAIYLGGGQIVHASTPATGVKVSSLYGSYFFVRV